MSSTDARIALLRQAMSRRGLSPTSCRPRTRTFPNTCRRAGRAALAVGLHGLGGHVGGHGRFRRPVGRQPLLGAGRGAAGRHRRAADEDRAGHHARPCGLAGRQHAGGSAHRRGRTGAGPGGLPRLVGRRRRVGRLAGDRRRPAGRHLEGRAGLPDARIYEHVAPQAASAAPTSWRRCARPCAWRRRAFHQHARRHRLALQPARRRRGLQPGVRRPCAGRPGLRHAVRGRRQGGRDLARRPGRGRRGRRWLCPGRRGAGLAGAGPDPADRPGPRHLRRVPRHESGRAARRGDQSVHAAEVAQDRGRTGQCAPGHGTGRRGAVRVLRLVRRRAGRTHHRADHRRTDHRGPRAPARLCSSQLRHHRRLQRQRRHAALPRHRRIARRDRRRWPAADRLGRPVSGRHHRHHPRGRGGRPAPTRRSTSRWCSRA